MDAMSNDFFRKVGIHMASLSCLQVLPAAWRGPSDREGLIFFVVVGAVAWRVVAADMGVGGEKF